MLTTARAREILGEHAEGRSDVEIEDLCAALRLLVERVLQQAEEESAEADAVALESVSVQ